MKNLLFFAGGLVIGVLLTVLCFTFLIKNDKNATDSPKTLLETEMQENTEEQQREKLREMGITLFEEIGDVINEESVQVFQVIAEDAALVNGKGEYSHYIGPVYLIVNNEGEYYYDEEIIEVSKDQEFRQIGIYRYETNSGYKTVPIIGKVDKDLAE